jgi:tyrosine-protein kinase Etk/Wzc
MKDAINQEFVETDIRTESSSFDIKKIIGSILRNWYWVVGCVIVSLFIGNLYLRYCTPLYTISSKILVKDDRRGGNVGGETQFDNLGLMVSRNTVENEVEIFMSAILMRSVVRDLHLNIRYFVSGRVKTVELYNNLPFKFSFAPAWQDTLTHFSILDRGKKVVGKWGDTVMLSIGSVVIESVPYLTKNITPEDQYLINIMPVGATAYSYASRISAVPINPKVSIINLTLVDQIPERGQNVLDKLMEEYMNSNVNQRNLVANNTINFIDDRLGSVGNDLSGIEGEIEQFKKANKVTDIIENTKILLTNNSEYNKKLTELEVQYTVLLSIEEYMRNNSNKTLPVSVFNEPSISSGTTANGTAPIATQEGLFNEQITRYNSLLKEKSELMLTNTSSNPMIVVIDQQLEMLRNEIKNILASSKRELETKIRAYKEKSKAIGDEITGVPTKQRIFLEFTRKENIKQELYLYLLKKKEEVAISRSSTVSNARVIDKAKAGGAISPNSSKIGLLLPVLIIYLRGMLDNRIINKEDITSNTSMPIIGEIGHYSDDNAVAVHTNSRSQLAEQFRALRTNLQFILSSSEKKCIMLTSSMSGEGKSFIAINLASTMAISGKKVLLMEMDLRKPKISKNLGIDNGIGFSNYAIGQVELNQVIVPSGVNENLFVLPSGPVPPNPSELVMLERVDALFERIKKDFDYIVIDTAPIGLVTDAQLISRFADSVLYVVRHAYTFKQQVRSADELFRGRKMGKMNIVANDVMMGGGSYYGYGYGYGSGYGYGYGYGYGGYGGYGYGSYGNNGYFDKEDNKRPNLLKRILNQRKKQDNA